MVYSLSVKITRRLGYVLEIESYMQVMRLRCDFPSFEKNTSDAFAFNLYILLSRTMKEIVMPLLSLMDILSPLWSLSKSWNTDIAPFFHIP